MRRSALALALLVGSSLLVGCGPEAAVDRGARLFGDPSLSPSSQNAFSCATCHAGGGGFPGRRYAGYTLQNSVGRPTWWGGSYRTLLEAVNECYVEFMRGNELRPEDPEGRALLVYLRSISPDASSPALPLTIVKDIVDVPNGDAGRGQGTYTAACAPCHGEVHTGRGRLSDRQTIVPEDTIREHGTTDPLTGARLITIEKVRHGRYFSIGGNMPPFSVETLSDGELGDILAYVGL